MKKHIHLLALAIVISTPCYSQELPEANQKVLDYAKSKIGQRVGEGWCFDLVDSALCQVNPNWKEKIETRKNNSAYRYRNGEGDSVCLYIYGEKIRLKDGKPGDIVIYENATIPAVKNTIFGKISGVAVMEYHVEILLSKNKNGTWNTMGQNIIVRKLKYSKVVVKAYYFPNFSRTITFYRPYPSSG